tara:strand:+ start:322 stop:450 length:129 start_codon:yes stop_codon:yes gene_type:complete
LQKAKGLILQKWHDKIGRYLPNNKNWGKILDTLIDLPYGASA